MSDDEETIEIRAELSGDWWYFAGMMRALLTRKRKETQLDDWRWVNAPTPYGCILHIGGRRPAIAHISFTQKDNKTIVSAVTIAGNEPELRPMLNLLKDAAHEARAARQVSTGYTADEAVELYYRSRASRRRVSLHDIADQLGFKYEALKKHKQRYDAAGKWGSKKGRDVPE